MFKVYISTSSLEKICRTEMTKKLKDRNDWYLVLSNQSKLYTDKENKDIEKNSVLFVFSQSADIQYCKSRINYNEEVVENPRIVLNEPQGVFLLDISKEKANEIQKRYGVICQSTEDLEDCPLIIGNKKELFKNKDNKKWRDLFNKIKFVPSNTLIFVDRYIFGFERKDIDDYKINIGYRDGLRNIKQILDSTLPTNLSCDYHVMILYDNTCCDMYFDEYKAIEELNNYVYTHWNYNVIVELYSINNQCLNWEDTHNRKLLSNYIIGTTEHGFKAFYKDGKAIYTQTVNANSCYKNGLKDESDPDIEMLEHLIEIFQAMHRDAIKAIENNEKNKDEYFIVSGKEEDTDVRNIKNRLIL